LTARRRELFLTHEEYVQQLGTLELPFGGRLWPFVRIASLEGVADLNWAPREDIQNY
jgi:hypothetical protein